MCLNAVLTIAGPGGKTRQLPIAEFFTLPSEGGIAHENVLQPGELVTEVFVPASPLAARSTYLKFREKNSMDWALSSVAMALETDGAWSSRRGSCSAGSRRSHGMHKPPRLRCTASR